MNSFGFFVSGFLLALLGAALPGWGYHVTEQHSSAGWLFLAIGCGVLAASQLRPILPRLTARFFSLAACLSAAAVLLLFGLLPSPVPFWAQAVLWLVLGISAGLLNLSLFESMRQAYDANPAGTVSRAGLYFVSGCLASSVAVALSLRFGFVSQTPVALALVPFLFGMFSLRQPVQAMVPTSVTELAQAFRIFSKPGALLFALLLVLQSGSEWTVAGWLPVFLTRRTGAGPEVAVWMLAFYWFVLLVGRATNGFLLARVSHSRFLFGSALSTLLGCFLLVSTDNLLGATAGVFFLGNGFAGVFPLLANKMASRFPEYHTGLFNAIFSVALSGGLLSSWLAGLLADSFGLMAVMALPAAATLLCVGLLLVLWLESKVTGR